MSFPLLRLAQRCAGVSLLVGLALLGAVLPGCNVLGSGPDERAPRVEILRPFDDAFVGGEVLIRVEAQPLRDDNFISFVNITLGGELLGAAELMPGADDEAAPQFLFRWDTEEHPDGRHRLEAVAFDRYQARGLSAPVSVRIGNESPAEGPSVSLLAPHSGDVVSGQVPVVAATGGAAAARVDVLIDGIVVASLTEAPYTYVWDASGEALGPHTVQVRAYDAAGAFSEAPSAEVTVAAEGGTGLGSTTPGLPRFQAGGFSGRVPGSVAVGFNGDLYLGTLTDTLYAFLPDGRLRWRFAARAPIRSSPVVASNEDVFFTSEDGLLYGLTASGAPLWSPYNAGAVVRSTPALGVDGTLYFGDTRGYLHAVNAFSGRAVSGWPVQVSNSPLVAPPVLASDRTIFAASTDGYVYAYQPDGTFLWQAPEELGPVTAPLALVERVSEASVFVPGSIELYLVTTEGVVTALAGYDGSVLWQHAVEGPLYAGPVVGSGRMVYVGTSSGLVALDAGAEPGANRLRFIYRAKDVGLAAVGADEAVFFVSGRSLVAVAASGTPLWEYDLRAIASGPVTLSPEGLLYVAADNGLLYGVNSGTDGLAGGGWPMFQRNARHTGRK